MSLVGWYYLHTNGELIYKRDDDGRVADFRDSDLVRCFWPMDPTDRAGAWNIVIEASVMDANQTRLQALATLWACDEADADNYADWLGVKLEPFKQGIGWTAIVNRDTRIQARGGTKFAALVNLADLLGVRAGKMWRRTFKDLVNG